MPTWLPIVAFVCAGLALLRYLLGIPLLWRFIRNADPRRIPKGETPPLRVIVAAPDAPFENLVAILRQNYPAFSVMFVGGEEETVERAHAAVPDVRPMLDEGHPVALTGDSRPDPLFLRDAANGLAHARVVSFVPVRFGMETGRARRGALVANTDQLLGRLLTGGRSGIDTAVAADPSSDKQGAALARRPLRVHAPDLPWEAGGFHALAAVAPLLLIAASLDPANRCLALTLLTLITLLRAVVAVTVDLAFARDGSALRSLPWLPALWFLEPFLFLDRRRGHLSIRAKLRGLWRTRSPTAPI
jgi:hypothetical protein